LLAAEGGFLKQQPDRYAHWPQYPLLKTVDVARILHVSSRSVCLWAECSEIPAIRVGKQWRFRQQDLAKWLDKSTATPEDPFGGLTPRSVKKQT
jgi:excisionase family DNA binding protein